MSAGRGGREGGDARAAMPMPLVDACAIEQRDRKQPKSCRHRRGILLSDSDNRTQSRRLTGRPRRNADATCRRVGHRATQPTPPVDARDINADSSTVTARPNAIVPPGGRRARGGDEWPPTPQRRCHLSTRGPSSNAADTTRQRAGHQRGLLLSDITTERNAGARGTTSVGGGARGHLRRNAADTTRQRAGHQRGVEKY